MGLGLRIFDGDLREFLQHTLGNWDGEFLQHTLGNCDGELR